MIQGSLTDKMNKADKACTPAEAKQFTLNIVRGLAYLHRQGMIHRDIKCANVLVDGSGKAKLGKLGEKDILIVTGRFRPICFS